LTLVLLSAVLFVPSTGWCVKIDPYTYHTVVGTVFFEYEHQSFREQQTQFLETTSIFRQDYGLSFSGNFLSRSLMIYDTSFDFERETTNSDSSKNSTNNFLFDITSTLLPRSRIPLTLFANRSKGSSSSSNVENNTDTTSTSLGLNWTGKFRVLPRMNLNISRNVHSSGNNDDNKETRVFYTADKEYGPTTNSLRLEGTFTDDITGSSSSTTNLNFGNITQLSRHSSLNLGLTRDSSDIPDRGTERTFGLTLGLTSYPSRFFTQTHNVTYFRTDSQDESFNGTTYSGSLQYAVSKKIQTNLGLSVSKVFTETLTDTEDSTSVNASSSILYKLTQHFSVSESLNANFTASSSSQEGVNNLSDRKLVDATNNLNYYRSFSRATLGASYGLGYLYDTDINLETSTNGGQAITHNGSLTLSRIDFSRFFFFDAGLSFSGVLKTTAGTVNDKVRSYRASFYNRFWKKYINIRGSFVKYNDKTAVEAIEEKSETSDLTLSSSPIKGSNVSMGLQRLVFFNDFTGFTQSNSGHISAGYGHRLLGGPLSGNVTYSIFDRTFNGGSDITRTTDYLLSYERRLLRRVMWKFDAARTVTRIEEFLSRDTTFTNVAFYRLRAWSFSLSHTYAIREDSTREQRENTILFKIGRQFIRRF